MFWTFKKSFDVDVEKLGDFFFKKSGHPVTNASADKARTFVRGKYF
jgi:hypothetical protein